MSTKTRKHIKTAIRNVLYGAGTVVQIWPERPTMRTVERSPDGQMSVRRSYVLLRHREHGFASDCKALQSDWARIGGDMKVALAEWRRDYEKER
jgi:hypothetical protein